MKVMLYLLGILIVGLSFPSEAFARNYKMAGCGLGSLVIKEDGIIQVVAATTNATSGSQTFGITSGTSNCLPAQKHAALMKQEEFFSSNFSAIAKETAQGDGENLRALSAHLGCSNDSYANFAVLMKTNYQEIFSAPGAITALNRTKARMKDSPQLARACADII